MTERLRNLKTALWALVGVLAAVTVVRFTHGLGAVTNLSDAAPWGLWIGFDVMSGVALAAGGFVLAGIVYIFGLERYRPFVRAAILTALLGYAAVAVGLLYDLGLPWRVWHPMIHWQCTLSSCGIHSSTGSTFGHSPNRQTDSGWVFPHLFHR